MDSIQLSLGLDEPSKACFVCGVTKPLTAFYVHSRMADGHLNKCKECTKQQANERRAENHDEHIARDRERWPDRRDAENARKREKIAANPEPNRTASRAWRAANLELAREKSRQRHAANRDAANAKRRAHYEAHKEERAVRMRAWREANPGYDTVKQAKRRGLIRDAHVSDLTGKQWKQQMAYFNNHCGYCNAPMIEVTQEHMQPLSKGGDHTIANVIPCCRRCNLRKHDKTLVEWLLYQ